MERLYIHLKEASLSPIGDRKPSTKREFRASFIKRCKNQTVNDRLHLIRTLNSTLKVHFFIYTPLKIVPDSWKCSSLLFTKKAFCLKLIFPLSFTFSSFPAQSKEADLQAIEQVLSDPRLTSDKFREWKEANVPLVQEIYGKQKQQVAAEATKDAASVSAAPLVESSL